jgi:hypothetical protein
VLIDGNRSRHLEEAHMPRGQRLTKGLATAGTVLVWLPLVLSPVLVLLMGPQAIRVKDAGMFLLVLAVGASDLYPLALVGGCLLMWAAVRTRSHRRLIGLGLAAQIADIAVMQVRNVMIASGGPAASASWPEWAGLVSTFALWAGWIVVAVAGVSLVYALFSRGPQSQAPASRYGYPVLGASVGLALVLLVPTLAYLVLWEPAQIAAGVPADSMESRPAPGFGEPNDDKAHATLLKPGQQVDASLETSADVDVYRIEHFEPARGGLIRWVGEIRVLQTDAQGRTMGESYSDPAPKGTSQQGVSIGTSLSFDPGDAPWPLYIYVRREPGSMGDAYYRILVPRALR